MIIHNEEDKELSKISETTRSFVNYLRILYRKWFLLALLIVDILGLGIGLANPQLKIATSIFWLLTILALLWASFEVYRDVAPYKLQEPKEPKLVLELIEGNQYSYEFLPDSYFNKTEEIPDVQITLRLMIQNLNAVDLKLLAVSGSFLNLASRSIFLTSFGMSSPETQIDQKDYPILIPARDGVQIDFFARINFSRSYNPTQFASRLAQITNTDAMAPQFRVNVETQIPSGKIIYSEEHFNVSIKPLKQNFISLWRELGRLDLLQLVNTEPLTTNQVESRNDNV